MHESKHVGEEHASRSIYEERFSELQQTLVILGLVGLHARLARMYTKESLLIESDRTAQATSKPGIIPEPDFSVHFNRGIYIAQILNPQGLEPEPITFTCDSLKSAVDFLVSTYIVWKRSATV